METSGWTPLDVRKGLTNPLSSDQRVRWGICGTGRVCHDFVQALKGLPNAELACVAARSAEKAKEFATRHSIARSYKNFKDLAEKGDFDVLYIGTLHTFHREQAEPALRRGRHVLIEKPITTRFDDLQALTELAKSKSALCVEGLWTRFFPAVERTRERLESGEIGEVKDVVACFGVDADDTGDDSSSDFFRREVGGGCINYVGIYPLTHLTFALGAGPTQTICVGHMDKNRVDLNSIVALKYDGGVLGTAVSSAQVELAEETTISGKEGRIRLLEPAHCPTSYSVYRKFGRNEGEEETFNFELPPVTEEVKSTGGFNYVNSQGFQYEAEAVMRAVVANLTELPQYPMEEMLNVHRLMDEIRAQLDGS